MSFQCIYRRYAFASSSSITVSQHHKTHVVNKTSCTYTDFYFLAILGPGILSLTMNSSRLLWISRTSNWQQPWCHLLTSSTKSGRFHAADETAICWQLQVSLHQHVPTTGWVIDLSGRVKWLGFLSCYAPFQGNLVLLLFHCLLWSSSLASLNTVSYINYSTKCKEGKC